MSFTTSTEDQVPKIPNLELNRCRFILSNPKSAYQEDSKETLFKEIKENDMAPFYKLICEENSFTLDESLYSQMVKNNEDKLNEFEKKIEEAKESEGETEILDVLSEKANYIAKIGDKEGAVKSFHELYEKGLTIGQRLDILFSLMRIGFFYNDNSLISVNIDKAKELLEEGGDWDRRNRLKVYEGIYLLSIRDFTKSCSLLLDSIATFTSSELMEYKEFVKYTVIVGMLVLNRVDMKKKIIDSPEILEVLHEIPHLDKYVNSLYQGLYKEFFESLASVEEIHLFNLEFIFPHHKYYIREMRIKGYSQLLESYRSVTLENMANSFGVTVDFIDRDVSKFIAAGRLHCVIDKVNGIIETNRPDSKYAQYQTTIKQGDVLLNRIQKLSRVINI